MKIIDNVSELLGDDLKREITPGSKVRIAASTFSIFAFEALRKELDPQAEFRDRIAAHGTDPEPVRALKERVEVLTEENQRLREQLREARSTIAMLERHIVVDVLESSRTAADPTPSRKLRPVPEPVQPAEGPPSDPKG